MEILIWLFLVHEILAFWVPGPSPHTPPLRRTRGGGGAKCGRTRICYEQNWGKLHVFSHGVGGRGLHKTPLPLWRDEVVYGQTQTRISFEGAGGMTQHIFTHAVPPLGASPPPKPPPPGTTPSLYPAFQRGQGVWDLPPWGTSATGAPPPPPPPSTPSGHGLGQDERRRRGRRGAGRRTGNSGMVPQKGLRSALLGAVALCRRSTPSLAGPSRHPVAPSTVTARPSLNTVAGMPVIRSVTRHGTLCRESVPSPHAITRSGALIRFTNQTTACTQFRVVSGGRGRPHPLFMQTPVVSRRGPVGRSDVHCQRPGAHGAAPRVRAPRVRAPCFSVWVF